MSTPPEPPRDRDRQLLETLQQRLFEISRRNRLLHFRPTQQTVNLTLASVPLEEDAAAVRPEDLLTWNDDFRAAVLGGKPIALGRRLLFDEALYLPGALDNVRAEARRDRAEFGFEQLRLALCFLRWANVKEKPAERFDTPLLLLPVTLTRKRGVRDTYHLDVSETTAEVNPVLRHYWKQLFDVSLPETVDLDETPLDAFYDSLVTAVRQSEPAVAIEKIDRPRVAELQAAARQRLEQYLQRAHLSGTGISACAEPAQAEMPVPPRLLQLLTTAEVPAITALANQLARLPEPDPTYRWEFDLCNLTLGNFRSRKMSLVRDYQALLANGHTNPAFEAVFSPEPRPIEPAAGPLPPLEERFPVIPCDPTQSAAVARARTGTSYIIQGPPGTGKSQTITNLIADYVTRGKRVLFVCQKRAALDVVYHRLQQTGLHVLCSIIHDSQADKKAFVLDLKQTYESFLNGLEPGLVTDGPAKAGIPTASAEKERQKVLQTLDRELAPLKVFHEAMVGTPEGAGLPFRRLLHRAVELGEQTPKLSALDQEKVPPYVQWLANRERVERLANNLHDDRRDAVFAHHPLACLCTRLTAEQRPLEFLTERMKRAEPLLEALEAELAVLGVEPALGGSLEKLGPLAAYVQVVLPLAEKNHVTLLDPDSPAAQKLAQFVRAYQEKTAELARAQEANKEWRQKLPADETRRALEQARALGHCTFSFLKPVWWRLRRLLGRAYNFRAHAVRPTWVQVLEALDREHQVRAERDAVAAQARQVFGFPGSLDDFANNATALRERVAALAGPVRTVHATLIMSPDADAVVRRLAAALRAAEELEKELAAFLEEYRSPSFAELRQTFKRIEASLDNLPDFLICLGELAALPPELVRALRTLPLDQTQLEAAMAHGTILARYRADRALARFKSATRARHVERLEKAYEAWHAANAGVVRERVRRQFLEHVQLSTQPAGGLADEQKAFRQHYVQGRRELEHEFGKSMRYKSIRELAAGAPGLVVRDLKPVWLMSPLSVSDTLPLDTQAFDVVIFDEASQVPLEEAVPAVFRAAQVIVVGDEMQLPPTNFFSARRPAEEDRPSGPDDTGDAEPDVEGNSFLNHAARKLPSTLLGWHYRSRSESLISFSNAAFYQGRLLTVPARERAAAGREEIQVDDVAAGGANVDALLSRPVSFHFLEHGVYDQRRNTAEADYIAHLVRGLLAKGTGQSIGIVAFSEAQQDEIQDALKRLAHDDRDFRDRLEAEYEREEDGQFLGLLVKNLENIQGDERDVVILSVCYGPGPDGRVLMHFGPINQAGGEKRLNVAFSRARCHMAVVSSMHGDAITNDHTEGARCLKTYLRYAEALSAGNATAARLVLRDAGGPLAAPSRDDQATPDAVVDQLAAALAERGWQTARDVGQSAFRCDLAVYRDDDPSYRAAVLVDTDAAYRRADVLEREVLRPKLLRAFGWNVVHVLTKDWRDDREGVLKEIESILTPG